LSVTPFLSHQGFDPETAAVVATAFDKVCAELRLCPRQDRLTEIVAREIIEAAKKGSRNETAICLSVLEHFKPTPR
jgi:hypothetical protein